MMDSQPVPATSSGKIDWRLVGRGVLLLVLLGLCGFGLAAAPFWKQHAQDYWLWVVPGFGVLSILLCLLSDTRRRHMLVWEVLQHQVLQWVGTAAAVYIMFWLIRQNFFNVEAAGPAATLLIALSIYFSGITFDGSLVVIALLLGGMTVGAVYMERVTLVVAGLAVILGIACLLLRPVIKNYRGTHITETPLPQSTRANPNLQ